MSTTSVFKQASLSTLIVGAGLVTSFVKVIFFTRALTVSDYGVLSLLSTTILVLSYFFSLGTFQYIYKEQASSNVPLSTLKSVCVGIFFVAIAFFLFGLWGRKWVSHIYAIQPIDWILTLLISATSGLLFILIFYIYGQRQVVYYNLMLFIRSYAWVYIAIPIIFVLPLSITIVLTCWLIFTIVAFGFSINKIGFNEMWFTGLNFKPFYQSIRYGFPLLPSFLAVWGMLAICKYILAYISDTTQVALFSLSYTLFDIVFLFAINISQVFSPYFFREWNQPEGSKNSVYFNMAMKYSIILTVILSLGLFLLGDNIIALLAGEKYVGATAFGALFVFLPFLRVLTVNLQQRHLASDKTKQLGIIYLFSFALIIATCLWWGKLWDVYGVILSLLFTQFAVLMLISFQTRGEVDLNNDDLRFFRLTTISIILAAFIFFIVLVMPEYLTLKVFFAILFPFVYFFLLIKTSVISKKEISMIEARLSQIRLSFSRI